jgi:hypothetical protein
MFEPNTLASPAALTMVTMCVAGIAFMARFFMAVTDDKKMRIERTVRSRGVDYAKHIVRDPGAHVALGVFRITSALASNSGRRDNQVATNAPHVVRLVKTGGNLDSASEPVYRHLDRRSG